MTQTKSEHRARYLYPGAFLPEDVSRTLPEPTWEAALAAGPDEDGYFKRDGWYAVEITTTHLKEFRAEDGETTWVPKSVDKVGSWVVGERIHWQDIPATHDNRILIDNIKGNSKDGHGVRTRCGNWQIASDYQHVVTPAEATR